MIERVSTLRCSLRERATSDRVRSHERSRARPNSHERPRRCRRLLKELPAGVALIPLAGRDTRTRYRDSCDRIAFNRARISRFSDSVTRDTSVLLGRKHGWQWYQAQHSDQARRLQRDRHRVLQHTRALRCRDEKDGGRDVAIP